MKLENLIGDFKKVRIFFPEVKKKNVVKGISYITEYT